MTTMMNARSSLRLLLGASFAAMAVAAGCNDEVGEPGLRSQGAAAVQNPIEGGEDPSISRIHADGEESIGGEHVATLPTVGGSKLIFIGERAAAVTGAGADESVIIVSATAPGTVDISSLPELVSASPLEVFNAASAPGTAIPPTIARLYGREPRLGPQGWGLEVAAKGGQEGAAMIQTGHCNNTNFTNKVNSFEYNDRGSPLFRLDQTPGVDSDNVWKFYDECFGTSWAGGECPSYYKYNANWPDVDGFYWRVAVCDLDVHPTLSGNWGSWTHPGPTIQFWSRAPGSASFDLTYGVDVKASEVGYAWHIKTAGINYDRTLVIKEAEAADGFDIATSVEDL